MAIHRKTCVVAGMLVTLVAAGCSDDDTTFVEPAHVIATEETPAPAPEAVLTPEQLVDVVSTPLLAPGDVVFPGGTLELRGEFRLLPAYRDVESRPSELTTKHVDGVHVTDLHYRAGSGDPISYWFEPASLREAMASGVATPETVPVEGVLTTWLRIAPQGGFGKLEYAYVPVGRLGQRAMHRPGDGTAHVYGISMTAPDSLEYAQKGLPDPEDGALELVFDVDDDALATHVVVRTSSPATVPAMRVRDDGTIMVYPALAPD
ncbi:MAG: hypothetical protein H6825_05440 [Planctomycetes bacterium]|nr:hypothetical protein [Planctomycetota bacterium]